MKMKRRAKTKRKRMGSNGQPRPSGRALLLLGLAAMESHHLALGQTMSPAAGGTSSISGHSFFDSDLDGSRDPMNTLDYGIYDMAVFLFTCGDVNLVRTGKTDALGTYAFDDLAAGSYYVNVPTVPSWYQFTDVWSGATDPVTGAIVYPAAESAVDPATGSTACFEVVEGEAKVVDFGMVFDTGPPPTPPPTDEPTPSPVALAAPPSASPVKAPTLSPSISPVVATAVPTKSPILGTISPTTDPTSMPSAAPTVQGSSSPSKSTGPTPAEMTSPPSDVGSEAPSTLGTQTPSVQASHAPSLPPSGAPTLSPSSSLNPSGAPTMPPSKYGVWVGPTVTERLIMTLRGIDGLEDEEAWKNITSEHIMDYYIVNDDAGVWNTDVAVRIVEVFNETTEGGGVWTFPEKAVEVIYTQRSTYKTADPELLDEVYVATQPFQTLQGVEAYIAALQQLSPFYDDVTEVDMAFLPPTAPPSVAPSLMPSVEPTVSYPPTAFPTAPPSRYGELVGPNVTERLVMTIRGIDQLEDEEEWAERTSEYITDYFVVYDDAVWDVEAEIVVTQQNSSNPEIGVIQSGNDGLFERRRSVRGGQERGLQEGTMYVEVTYNQRSIYKTKDRDIYDAIYVATQPFTTREGIEAYIAALQELSPHYNDIVSIGSVKVNPPIPVKEGGGDESESGSDNTLIYIIVGSVCGGAILIAAIVMIVYRRRHKGRDELSQRSPNDLEAGSSGSSSSDFQTIEAFSEKGGSQKGSPRRTSSDSPEGEEEDRFSENAFAALPIAAAAAAGGEVIIDVLAPAGKLGVIVDTPPAGGTAYVCEIKDTSPLIGQIRLEDKIVAVDDEDVRGMTAVNVSKLLARRSKNTQRKITVLRKKGEGDDESTESSEEEASAPLTAAAAATTGSSVLPMSENPEDAGEGDESQETIEVIAPAGKLGVVLVTPEPPATGPAYVFNIRDDSPLQGKVKMGDKVIAVDDQDVRGMTAINVSKLLGSKSSHEERRIKVLREVSEHDDEDLAMEEALKPSASAESSPSRSIAAAAAAVSTKELSSSQTAPSTADDRISNMMSMTPKPENAAAASPKPAKAPAPARPATPTGEKMDIIAPAGKLGVVVDSPPEGGSAYVSDVKPDSPIFGQIKMGDRILSVDDEDVSKLKAIHVSMLLGSKSRNAKRKITVLREPDPDE